jgi:two-component system, cell cycle response regulator
MADDRPRTSAPPSSDDGSMRTLVTSVPAPAIRSRAVLVMMSGPELGRVISVKEGSLTLGRSEECDARLDDSSLSRVHAQIVRVVGNWMFADKGSTNGSTINDRRVEQPQRLADGDRIRLGSSTTLRFALVDEKEEQALQSVYQATTLDALTGVANRKQLEQRLDAELAFAVRHDAPLSVILVDVDHFKRVNDEHGHLAGDAVLKNVAATLSRGVRTEDVIARYGGEEFLTIARGIGKDEATVMAERLRQLVNASSTAFDGREIRVTVSAGVASLTCCGPRRDKVTLLGLADARLYRAKQGGRNRVVARD